MVNTPLLLTSRQAQSSWRNVANLRQNTTNERVSKRMKLVCGVVLPLTAFLLFNSILLGSVSGQGEALGFAGMALFFRLLIILPLVLFANALLMCRGWRSKRAALFVGLVPPTAAALYEYFSIYGAS